MYDNSERVYHYLAIKFNKYMPLLNEIGIFKRQCMRRSLSDPIISQTGLDSGTELVTEQPSQFKKLVNKLACTDNRQNDSDLNGQVAKPKGRGLELIELNDTKKIRSQDENSSVYLLINQELTSKLRLLESKLKASDTLVEECVKRLSMMYTGLKVT